MEIQVKGHSGCQIDIVNDGNNLYIYKSTHDPKYINRLYLQAKNSKRHVEELISTYVFLKSLR